MASNIEIKARARDYQSQAARASEIAGGPATRISQRDTFFHAPSGRLKLREFGDGTGELIQYHRSDAASPRPSDYVLSRTSDPASLKRALGNALGVRAVVAKRRELYLVGQTRIHFDDVQGLGKFIELEVVLRPEQDPEEGIAIAQQLMIELGIVANDLVAAAYVDLLEAQDGDSQSP